MKDDSGLLGRGASCAATVVVAVDRDDKGGEVAVADDPPKPPFGRPADDLPADPSGVAGSDPNCCG